MCENFKLIFVSFKLGFKSIVSNQLGYQGIQINLFYDIVNNI